MDQNEILASEWAALQQHRQELADQVARLRIKLINFSSDPEILPLLKQKSELKKKAEKLSLQVVFFTDFDDRFSHVVEMRRRSCSEKQIKEYIGLWETQLFSRPALLVDTILKEVQEHIKGGGFSQEITPEWMMSAPLEELEKAFERGLKELSEGKLQLREMLESIASIEENYRQSKKCLESAIKEVEKLESQRRSNLIEWATKDRAHVSWVIRHQPAYKEEVLSRYKALFPHESVLEFLPAAISSPSNNDGIQKPRKRSRSGSGQPLVPIQENKEAKTWKMWVTLAANDVGTELPEDRKQFLAVLQSVLTRADYHSLNVGLVYDKLMALLRMSTQQRQQMDKVLEGNFEKWKILRLGKKHRIFLLIDEEKCHVRFIPQTRKKSYGPSAK